LLNLLIDEAFCALDCVLEAAFHLVIEHGVGAVLCGADALDRAAGDGSVILEGAYCLVEVIDGFGSKP
jgi:hypothetical protein